MRHPEQMSETKIVYAGDRDIAVKVLDYLRDEPVEIAGLLLPERDSASHDQELLSEYDKTGETVLRGGEFRESEGKQFLREIEPDYIISIHFQYIYPKEVLEIPEHGVVNLHPAYLPYNRGWHTPSWAIWEETLYGATLHFMEEEVDAGDIIARKQVEIRPDDTADSLYNRVKDVEYELFRDTWPELANEEYDRLTQSEEEATAHRKADLEGIREIDPEETMQAKDMIRKLRALTTNRVDEAAYFVEDGTRYRIQVEITPDKEDR